MLPASAAAQFTTFIPPKNKVQDSVKAVVAEQQRARADSMTAASLTNMKTWVDSAAGVVPPTRADSAIAAVDSATFPNGSRAPMTASALPLLIVIGAASLGVGAFLLSAPTGSGRRRA